MSIHIIHIKNKKEELAFQEILANVGVKIEKVMCRHKEIFGGDTDEYIVSDGLYKQISGKLNSIRV